MLEVRDSTMRHAALEILKNYPTNILDRYAKEVVSKLQDRDEDVRFQALLGLIPKFSPGKMVEVHAYEAIVARLQDRNASIRKFALKAIKEWSTERL